MSSIVKLGIIICDRYRNCAGGKCFRALHNREGAFSIYRDLDVELAGYATCGGCPGGNIEYAPMEMVKNGVEVIHLATGFIVGYPPCPYLSFFTEFIPERTGVKLIVGTHPIPEKYNKIHSKLQTWNTDQWHELIKPTLADEKLRLAYD